VAVSSNEGRRVRGYGNTDMALRDMILPIAPQAWAFGGMVPPRNFGLILRPKGIYRTDQLACGEERIYRLIRLAFGAMTCERAPASSDPPRQADAVLYLE
jgi:hypothetical protein